MQDFMNTKSFRQHAGWCRHMASLMRTEENAARWLAYSDEWERLADLEDVIARRCQMRALQLAQAAQASSPESRQSALSAA
jgi:hypothetical protein